jgi:arginase
MTQAAALLASTPLARTAPLRVLGFACGRGANDPRCADGPKTLMSGDLERWFRVRGIELNLGATIEADKLPALSAVDAVADACRRLEPRVRELVDSGTRFAVVGGDHTCAIGTWSGAREALKARGPFGLLWIDAHMDSHTPETSLSGKLHGMPLACLLGHGPGPLTALTAPAPVLAPSHVCLVGVRSFEEAERLLLAHLGVKVFFMDDVHRRGLAAVMEEALGLVRRGTAAFGVSIDLDAVDPVDAPGVSLPVPGGLRADDLVETMLSLAREHDFLGIEIAEFNPYRDRYHATIRTLRDLIAAATGGHAP